MGQREDEAQPDARREDGQDAHAEQDDGVELGPHRQVQTDERWYRQADDDHLLEDVEPRPSDNEVVDVDAPVRPTVCSRPCCPVGLDGYALKDLDAEQYSVDQDDKCQDRMGYGTKPELREGAQAEDQDRHLRKSKSGDVKTFGNIEQLSRQSIPRTLVAGALGRCFANLQSECEVVWLDRPGINPKSDCSSCNSVSDY